MMPSVITSIVRAEGVPLAAGSEHSAFQCFITSIPSPTWLVGLIKLADGPNPVLYRPGRGLQSATDKHMLQSPIPARPAKHMQ